MGEIISNQIVRMIFSGTKPQDIVNALHRNSKIEDSPSKILFDMFFNAGYWRANIRTLEIKKDEKRLSYWHRDPYTDEVFSDRLALPFIDLEKNKFRSFKKRIEVESLWYKPKDYNNTTSYRCINWLKDHEFTSSEIPTLPMCVVHPGEMALFLMILDPEKLVPSEHHIESIQSNKLRPLDKFFQIKDLVKQWIYQVKEQQEPIYISDSFREKFFKNVISCDFIESILDEINDDYSILDGGRYFNDKLTDEIKENAQKFNRIRIDEWQKAGTRSLMIWPLIRIISDKEQRELEAYAFVVTRSDINISYRRAMDICSIVDTLFRQTISSELIEMERFKLKHEYAKALYKGILHDARNILKTSTTRIRNKVSPVIYNDFRSDIVAFQASLESHWQIYSDLTKDKKFKDILSYVRNQLSWSNLIIKILCNERILNCYINSSITFILIELIRNAYKYATREADRSVIVWIDARSSGDGKLKKLYVHNRGSVSDKLEIETKVGKLPKEEDLHGRLLITNIVLEILGGHWSLKNKDAKVCAKIEFS